MTRRSIELAVPESRGHHRPATPNARAPHPCVELDGPADEAHGYRVSSLACVLLAEPRPLGRRARLAESLGRLGACLRYVGSHRFDCGDISNALRGEAHYAAEIFEWEKDPDDALGVRLTPMDA
jgi:hypothetical protein